MLDEYERALKFYANPDNWDNNAAASDKGAIAREILEPKRGQQDR
jgi:hypothetical protein